MHKTKTAQEVFAENLASYGLTQQKVADEAKRAGRPVNQRTVGRALKDGNPTLKTLDAIAASVGAQAWQLLMPGNMVRFPRTGKAEELIKQALMLNETGLAAAIATIKGLAERAEFQQDGAKGKRQ